MRSVEVTAQSREEAIEQALKQLGVERDEIETEILQHGSKGFLGIGAREWQVRVSTESEAPAGAKPKREGGRSRGRRGGGGRQREKAEVKSRESKRDEGSAGKRDEGRAGKREGKPRSGGRRGTSDGPRGERKPRPERKPREERQVETPGEAEVAVAAASGPRKSTEASDTEAAALLQEMIQLMGIEASVSQVEDEDNNLRLAVSSEDSALLIGRKGRGLASLQYIINRIARGIEGRDETERIIVDVEGYLDRRKQSLEEMALRMAERVKETGRRFSMRPMNPQERRVVHVALQEDEEIRTFSVGDSAIRRVVIAPADEEREERPQRRPRRERDDRRDRGDRRDRDDRDNRRESRAAHGNGNADLAAENDADEYEFSPVDEEVVDVDDVAVADTEDDAAFDVRDDAPDDVQDDVQEAASVEANDNGEPSDEASTRPKRRRRSSTYRRGRR